MDTGLLLANKPNMTKKWWNAIEPHIAIFLGIMAGEIDVAHGGIPKIQTYLCIAEKKLEKIGYPQSASSNYELLLGAIRNLNLSLEHQLDNNSYQSNLFFEMAQANVDMLRLRLVDLGVML